MASQSVLPLQVQRAVSQPDGSAVVTLLTPAGAFLAGDTIRLEVECGPGTDVVLRQTGATRLHRCDEQAIVFDASMVVRSGARIRYKPFELIPFAGASYQQTIRLALDSDAQATLVEVISPGRLREHFAYRRLDLLTEVCADGRCVVRDRLRVIPGEMDCAKLLGGFTHVGSLLHLAPDIDQRCTDVMHESLATAGVRGSASLLPGGVGLVARVLGYAAEPLYRALWASVSDLPSICGNGTTARE